MSVPYNQTCKTDYSIFMLSKLDGSLVPRPSLNPVFDCLQYEKWSGRPGSIYHMSDASIYLGRRGGRERGPEQRGINFMLHKLLGVQCLSQHCKKRPRACSKPSFPLSHVVNAPRPSCSVLAHCM